MSPQKAVGTFSDNNCATLLGKLDSMIEFVPVLMPTRDAFKNDVNHCYA